MKKIPVLYESKELCCGCSVCSALCPANAISMVADDEGFLYPEINGDLCLRCNKCLSVCTFKVRLSKEKHRDERKK